MSDPCLEGHTSTTTLPLAPDETLCCHHLGIFSVLTSDPHFHFAPGPTNYVTRPTSGLETVPGLRSVSELLSGVVMGQRDRAECGRAGQSPRA